MTPDEFPDLDYLKSVIRNALVEKFLEGDERPCNESDFSDGLKIRKKLIVDIKVSIENLVKNISGDSKEGKVHQSRTYPDLDNEFLSLIFILCGQNVIIHSWNTKAIVQNCEDILAQILKLFNCKDVAEFFSRNIKVNLIKNILQILCNDLTATTWKLFPASVTCYKWILEMIEQPELSQHLQFVLPPALLLTDDFVKENRILGAQCLNHIVQNITIAELQFGGYGDVMYSALLPMLRIREAEIIQSIIPPLVSVTTKLEYNLGKKKLTKWSKFDEILEIFLENMKLEDITDLRNCYISNLTVLINATGCGITRWSKSLLQIFDEYIQTAGKYNNEATTIHCLKAINKFIQLTSGVIPLYAKYLLFTLLMALHSCGSCNNEIQKESREIAITCIKKISSFSQNETETLKMDLQKKFSCNVNCNKFCEEVINILQ